MLYTYFTLTLHFFTMKYNLLQKTYDLQCEMFIKGFIDLETFTILEEKYIKIYKLFIIYLN